MCPRKETMNLDFAENLVGLRVYPSVYDIKKYYQLIRESCKYNKQKKKISTVTNAFSVS